VTDSGKLHPWKLRGALAMGVLVLLAGAQSLAFPQLGDRVPSLALPPYLDRVPLLGDRWEYNAIPPSWSERVEVEVTDVEPLGEGARYLVTTRSLPGGQQTTEWFFLPDGQILHGDEWTDGVLTFDAGEPSVVVARRPTNRFRQKLRRSGTWHSELGPELLVEHRGRLRLTAIVASQQFRSFVSIYELATRSESFCNVSSPLSSAYVSTDRREQIAASYSTKLGLVGWERREIRGCRFAPATRVLQSAQAGGITYPEGGP